MQIQINAKKRFYQNNESKNTDRVDGDSLSGYEEHYPQYLSVYGHSMQPCSGPMRLFLLVVYY